jgi:hypothetical protein
MARFWLTAPERDRANAERWESADSVLLHRFASADDDEALHDHPWDFTTTILAGEYDEHLPPVDWIDANPTGSGKWTGNGYDDVLGPAWDQRIETRRSGDTVKREAIDLHSVGRVAPGTWTLVRTGPRIRDWGFHPHGTPWVLWREFLGVPAKLGPKSP